MLLFCVCLSYCVRPLFSFCVGADPADRFLAQLDEDRVKRVKIEMPLPECAYRSRFWSYHWERRRGAETHWKERGKRKKEKGKRGERVLTWISRKTRKDANEFLKIQNLFEPSVFTAFCIKIRVSLCVFRGFSGKTGTQFRMDHKNEMNGQVSQNAAKRIRWRKRDKMAEKG